MSAAENVNPAIAHVPLTTPADFTREIVRDIAQKHGVTVKELMSRTRVYRVSHARQAAIRRLLEVKPNWSIADAGRYFGLDHTTALYSLDRTGGGRLGRRRSFQPRHANAGANHNTNEGQALDGQV